MLLKVIGSGSSGNAYILENEREALLIEAGLPFSQIKKALGYNLSKVAACVVSHCHKDHSLCVDEFNRTGIPTIGPKGCKTSYLMSGYSKYDIGFGGFRIKSLPVQHDVPCMSYLVEHEDMGKLLFVTDTVSFNYVVDGLNHILIEANYCDLRLDENINAGLLPESLRERIVASHMEIGTTIDVLCSQDLSRVTNIVLVHLSEGNSDRMEFISRVQEATGKPTTVAVPGLEIKISKEPY